MVPYVLVIIWPVRCVQSGEFKAEIYVNESATITIILIKLHVASRISTYGNQNVLKCTAAYTLWVPKITLFSLISSSA